MNISFGINTEYLPMVATVRSDEFASFQRPKTHTHSPPVSDEKEIINFSAYFRAKWILFAIRVWIEYTVARWCSLYGERSSKFFSFFLTFISIATSLQTVHPHDGGFQFRCTALLFQSSCLPLVSTLLISHVTAPSRQNERERKRNVIWF